MNRNEDWSIILLIVVMLTFTLVSCVIVLKDRSSITIDRQGVSVEQIRHKSGYQGDSVVNDTGCDSKVDTIDD